MIPNYKKESRIKPRPVKIQVFLNNSRYSLKSLS